MTRAQYTIRSSWSDAGIVGGFAVAGRSGPTGVADALSTFAGAMVRAKLTLIAIAREVVALAKVSRYYLQE